MVDYAAEALLYLLMPLQTSTMARKKRREDSFSIGVELCLRYVFSQPEKDRLLTEFIFQIVKGYDRNNLASAWSQGRNRRASHGQLQGLAIFKQGHVR